MLVFIFAVDSVFYVTWAEIGTVNDSAYALNEMSIREDPGKTRETCCYEKAQEVNCKGNQIEK